MKLDFKKRPLSWSAISSFEYDKEQWYRSYILGEKQTSKEMTFGNIVDKRIQNDPSFLPEVPRYPLMQHRMKVSFNGIHLVGVPDGLDLKNFHLADFKTGKKAWDKKRANETGQLTMYLFLIYISEKIPPEKFKCLIHWLPTKDASDFSIQFRDIPCLPVTFETKRSMADILKFGDRINKTVKAMQEYVDNYSLLFAKKQSMLYASN